MDLFLGGRDEVMLEPAEIQRIRRQSAGNGLSGKAWSGIADAPYPANPPGQAISARGHPSPIGKA
ncbi:hypothetical protein [Burkholderia paludis]|uniref:hypothetical protein n=1 Tax=Burkholderia paludis TaxID=1506587 RepID=UPI00126A1160|nr:hypothetical protein [Burkholderia paludis]